MGVTTGCWQRESLPVEGDTVCNHTADSCSHIPLQSGRSPRRGNTQYMPAVGTGCSGHSCFCTLSLRAAKICVPTAAAAGSLNSRGEETHCSTPPITWLVLQALKKSSCWQQRRRLWRTHLLAARLSLRGLPPSPTAPWHSSKARFCSRSSGNWTKPQPLQRHTQAMFKLLITPELWLFMAHNMDLNQMIILLNITHTLTKSFNVSNVSH